MKKSFSNIKVMGGAQYYRNFLFALFALCLMPVASQANIAFEHFTSYAGVQTKSTLLIEDFNGDGFKDMATLELGALTIYLGNGNGSFQPPSSYPAGYSPITFIADDFNNDGNMDIATTNYDNTLNIILGNGDGTFMAGIAEGSTSAGVRTLTSTDVNNDGNSDVLTGSYSMSYPPVIQVFLGDGTGAFDEYSSFPENKPMPSAMHTADFNNDGNVDLVVAYPWASELGVYFGNGDGTFQDRIRYRGTSHVRNNTFSVEDINFDGSPDIVTMPHYSEYGIALINDGTGSFTEIWWPKNTTLRTTSMDTADFNCDGLPDMAVTGEDLNDSLKKLSIYTGNSGGTFDFYTNYTDPLTALETINSYAYVATGDLNNDGKEDLVFKNERVEGFSIFLNTGPGCGPASPGDLIDVVKEMHINGSISGPGSHGTAKSLTAKLEAAQAALDLDPPDYATAITALNDFINGVSAQSGKHIDPDAAAELIAYAEGFIAQYSAM